MLRAYAEIFFALKLWKQKETEPLIVVKKQAITEKIHFVPIA